MDRRREVLAALRAADAAPVSGEGLAADLGVSRAAVGKHVAALRDEGYTIEAAAGEGYRLTAVPEAPIPDEVRSRLAGDFWPRLEGGHATGSTNDDAKRLAREGAPEGTAVLATAQTAGRGRLGRTWASPEGGVYLSAVLRPRVSVADVPPLALVVALGLARGLETLGVEPALKWPNDLLLGDGKLGGVLLETSAEADRAEWVVAGCGLNVRRPATGGFEGAAYLEDVLAEPPSRAAVAAVALDGIAVAYGSFAGGGFAAVREAYGARQALTGRAVAVRDPEGGVVARGTVSGVDESGRLVVGTGDGPVAVSAGEVTLA